MKHIRNKVNELGFGGVISADTTFVLFFLALEYGRSVQAFSIDGALMGTTMLMVLALPYFLPSPYEKPLYGNWLAGRAAIAVFGLLIGLVFRQGVGFILPESIRFLPMTLLIVAAMVSCYLQFYSLIRLRPVK